MSITKRRFHLLIVFQAESTWFLDTTKLKAQKHKINNQPLTILAIANLPYPESFSSRVSWQKHPHHQHNTVVQYH